MSTSDEYNGKCCTIEDGVACPDLATFWVGLDGVDNYTYCCTKHLQETRKLFAPNGRAISLRLMVY